ncbi:MAG: response regulator [Blastocatellia bacterium]|nr:response regulator [Blastocatellia bacterium]
MRNGNGKINILLVDDNLANLSSLEAILQAPDRNMVRASSGNEALKFLLNKDAAVILLDVRMPNMDGLETAALIRGRERTHDIPIIFLTAHDSAGNAYITRSYALGAVDYIIKPIDPEALKSKVAVFVELYRKTEQIKQLYADLRGHAAALEQEIADRKRAESERAEMLARAQAAQAKAEEANRLKDEFLATVSHELRAPLTAMLGWVMLIREERLDRESKGRALETVERNARAQKKLIDDLLDVSSIVTGNFSLNIEPTDIFYVIEAAVECVRPEAEAKGVRLQMDLDPAAHLFHLDPNRFQQVIWNLVQNAVKFTPAGGAVEVRLRYVNGQAEIEVIDTGIGIAPEFLPFVFDRFRQANGSITRKHGGLGLGLAIVRSLVEMHGGMVGVESAGEGQGSTFKITLPPPFPEELPGEALQTAETGQESITPDSTPKLSGLRALVVDDQADMRELLAIILRMANAEVRTADSMDETMRIVTAWRPEILICDIAMPGGSGYELINCVRDGGCQAPAIAITARIGVEDCARSIAAGFQMHIPKPIEPRELVVSVAKLTGRLR